MVRFANFAALVLAAVFVQGCGSTARIADSLGVSKSSPDESQIRTTQSLAMPPDLQLRAPTGEVVEEDGQPASVANTSVAAAPPADATASASASDTAYTAPATSPSAGTQPVSTTPVDVYAKYGISRTKPDGTPKTEQELFAELRAAKIAEKRRSNPNYGTIFNIGELFKDG